MLPPIQGLSGQNGGSYVTGFAQMTLQDNQPNQENSIINTSNTETMPEERDFDFGHASAASTTNEDGESKSIGQVDLRSGNEIISSEIILGSSHTVVKNAVDVESRVGEIITNVMPFVKDKSLSLDQGTLLLNELQDVYKQSTVLEREDSPNNLQLVQLIKEVEGLVTEKNDQSSVITRRDVDMIKSFFTAPLMKFHIDPSSQVKYRLADNSKLLGIAMSLWTEHGGYVGVEVSKCKNAHSFDQVPVTITGKTSVWYDAIFLKKLPSESKVGKFISGASSAVNESRVGKFISGWIGSTTSESSSERSVVKHSSAQQQVMIAQGKVHKGIEDILLESYEGWGYLGFCILTSPDQLRALNLPEESCHGYHAVALFLPPYIEI